MAAKKKRKKARKGHKGHKKASTAKRGAARSKLKAGSMVKSKPTRKALAKAKLRVTGYKLGRRKKAKKGKR